MQYDERHGGPYDRGCADAYYGRPYRPHYFKAATNMSEEIEEADMTFAQVDAYAAGYDYAQRAGFEKDWGE